MKQKFSKLSFVQVAKELPEYMDHFDNNFVAIVDGTYSQLFGGTNINYYMLYQIEQGKIVNRCGWYEENQLTPLPEQNKEKAEAMVEAYNLKEEQIKTTLETIKALMNSPNLKLSYI